MNRRNDLLTKKIMMLISALMLTMLLCGCRTRITNNTGVNQTLEDANGMMSVSYQERRDELGIPVAEDPLFDRERSDEGDDEDDWDEDTDFEDFSDEDEEDSEEDDEDIDEEEEEDEDQAGRTTSPGSTGTQSRTQQTVIRRQQTTQHTTQTTVTYVKVTLNLNAKDATCSRTFLSVRKDSTYGMLPTPTRSGYTFEGWYTAKEKGSKVTSTTKVTNSKEHTLYAHWKKIKVKTYKITFDGNGEDDEVTLSSSETTVKEGGTYGKMPSAKREKYSFQGWYTDAEGGSKITKDTKFTANKDQTLYAHWEFEPYKWWSDEFKKATNEISDDMMLSCLIDGEKVEDSKKNFLKDCRCSLAESEEDAAYIVKFIDDFDNAAEEAEALYAEHSESNPETRVLIISTKALKSGKSKNQQLIYKMKTFEQLYGSSMDLYEAESDMLDPDEEIPYPYVYPE